MPISRSRHGLHQKLQVMSKYHSRFLNNTLTMPKTPKDISKKAKSKATSVKLYSSFLPIPLALPCPVPIASSSKTKAKASTAEHFLYVRPHKSSPVSDDDERTLFVANLPTDADEHGLRALFGKWGVVEGIHIAAAGRGDVLEAAVRGLPVEDSDDEDEEDEQEDEEKAVENSAEPSFVGMGQALPRSQRKRRKPNTLPPSVPDVVALPPTPFLPGISGMASCRVVFVDAVSVPRVMAYTGPALPLTLRESGLSVLEAQYAALRPPLALVKEHADSAMARYDHLHSLLLTSRAKAHGAGALVDEDGFTVVVRGGRYGRTAGRGGDPGGAGVAVASRNFDGGKKKKRSGAGPQPDFYKFQFVDRKRKGELHPGNCTDSRTRKSPRTFRRRQEKGRRAQGQQAVQAILGILLDGYMMHIYTLTP